MEISQKAKIIMRGIHNYICTLQLNARKNVNVGAHTKVRFANLANHVRIGDYCNIQRGGVDFYSYIGDCCSLPQTKIGKFCSIAPFVKLAAGNHPIQYLSTSPYTYSPIRWSFARTTMYSDEFIYTDSQNQYLCEIGNDVWIGTGALLVCSKSALHIGDGSVIAAGAVVTKDVPPYAIVAGCPARIMRYRFDERVISRLQELKWWDKDPTWIEQNCYRFSHPEQLLNDLEIG